MIHAIVGPLCLYMTDSLQPSLCVFACGYSKMNHTVNLMWTTELFVLFICFENSHKRKSNYSELQDEAHIIQVFARLYEYMLSFIV